MPSLSQSHKCVKYDSDVYANQGSILEQSSHFADLLHRGGAYRFIQQIDGKRRRSVWFAADEPVYVPRRWRNGSNVFIGVNPTDRIVTDEDRNEKSYRGKSDAEIAQYVGSKNRTIAALNTLFSEFDGKDFAQPSEAQIHAHFTALRNDPAKENSKEKALLNEATTAARKAVFLTDPTHYIEKARSHIDGLAVRPSVLVFSGGGWQAYWLLAETFFVAGDDVAFQRAKKIQEGWVTWSGGDPGAKDLRRVLRLPGLRNYKPAYAPHYPLVSFAEYEPNRRYALADLATLLPQPELKQPAQDARPINVRSVAGDDEPVREHSSLVYRVMAAYNDRHAVGSALESFGYTNAGNGRYSRPGEPDSKGVAILDGKAYVHSSNDPLFEVCGNHRLSAFDVSVHWDFGGDYEAAAAALAPGLGVFSQAVIDSARLIAQFADWSEIVPLERQSQNGYMTAQTDRLLFSNLVDICEERRRVAGLTVGLRQLAADTNSEGVPVSLCDKTTVKAWLERLNGTVLSAEDVDGRTVISLNTEVITALAGAVAHRSTILNNQAVCTKVVDLCATESTLHETTTGAFHERKADDAFLRGRSAPVIGQIRSNMNALCAGEDHYAAAALAYDQAKTSKPEKPSEWIALMGLESWVNWCELKARACEEFLPGLGTFGLLVLAELASNEGLTKKEIAERRGLKESSVGRTLRKLDTWGLVDVVQDGANKPKVYSVAGDLEDVWSEVAERTPEAMTYTIGVRRRERQLQNAQEFKARGVATATDEETERKVRRQLAKIEKKRRLALTTIHPDLSSAAIEDMIREGNAKGTRRTAQPSTFAERRLARMAPDNDPYIPVESAAATFIADGCDLDGVYFLARQNGYTKEQAAKIESLVNIHGGPVEYVDLDRGDDMPTEQLALQDERQPLPLGMWLQGLTLEEARDCQRAYAGSGYKTTCGQDSNGYFFVRAVDWRAYGV